MKNSSITVSVLVPVSMLQKSVKFEEKGNVTGILIGNIYIM